MKKTAFRAFCVLLLSMQISLLHAQSTFREVKLPGIGSSVSGGVLAMRQDRQGYMWILTRSKGLLKYDGSHCTVYTHNDKDPASISSGVLETMAIDSDDVIWVGTLGGGLDRLDPVTNKFTHFKHQPNNPGSLAHDTVTAILLDHDNNLWIGTYKGLDLYDRTTGKFIHHAFDKNDATSLSSNHVRAIYEDKEGALWVGCGSPFTNEGFSTDDGGLNRFDKRTGKFIRYLHNPNDPASISNNKVRAILEDSKGNFWIGTAGDGLQTLSRQTGIFTHYYYDSTHPEKLSSGPLANSRGVNDHITFINEDTKGNIWIGTFFQGITAYNLQTKRITHYGVEFTLKKPGDVSSAKLIAADTATGFKNNEAWSTCITRDGLLWICTLTGSMYQVDDFKKIMLPFTYLRNALGANSFYKENDSTVWIATAGLIKRNTRTGKEKIFLHDSNNPNSLNNNTVLCIKPDGSGSLWIGTLGGGLDKFNPATDKFTHYDLNVPASDAIQVLYTDDAGNLWVGTTLTGVIEINKSTRKIAHFQYNKSDSATGLIANNAGAITGDKTAIWVATTAGLDKIEKASGKVYHYLQRNAVTAVLVSIDKIVWAGTSDGLYYYDTIKNSFTRFNNPAVDIGTVISLNTDKRNNTWISSSNTILEIKADRKQVRIYNSDNGVHTNGWTANNDYISAGGEVFIGNPGGYYSFYADSVQELVYPPQLDFASLQIGGQEIRSGESSILNKPLYSTAEIRIPDDKNSFSVTLSVIDFRTNGDKKVLYMLQGYDDQWHEINSDRIAYFYNLPIGDYKLKARAVTAKGAWVEKTLSIVITPPWWQTWWAIAAFILSLIGIVWVFIYYRSRQLVRQNKILEEKVAIRTRQLNSSLEELRSTQTQLIQSEKMASLGELTAGIAHEIQNPLNFVNNFSEVNKELLEELKAERLKPNADTTLQDEIINDVIANEVKINHHGKRADAIVKGMLQHSRSSNGIKELTDINKLADEYLRLSYHGLRAKDKNFNAAIKTDFNETIERINIISQDIGRVLLNLFNNAFYAVNEKFKGQGLQFTGDFKPLVSVSTRKISGSQGKEAKVEIVVTDNGNGIPQNIVNKIFQPFFTTKPTGEGTGLGLSLSYDIIKAHGGEIKVQTTEGEGSVFTITLPI